HSSKESVYRNRCGTYALRGWLQVKAVSGLNKSPFPLAVITSGAFQFTACPHWGRHSFGKRHDMTLLTALSTGPWYRWTLVCLSTTTGRGNSLTATITDYASRSLEGRG